ncbi:MAG: exosortase system-associated protein, TIGR04073 family [Methylovulum sp.]|nr:exosortase system-associated protein, TIGR04073 family [Methylovulum sp.]
MNKYNRFFVTLLFTGLIGSYATISQAECSYGQKIGEKALRTLTNMGTNILELPKNVINVTNESNIFYGLTGGGFKGLLNMVGRMSVGLADLISLPIPTKPVAYPLYIWDDFDIDTTYNGVFRLDTCPEVEPVAETPVVQPVSAPVVAPRAPIVDDATPYNQQTNRQLDTLFKKRMMK